MGLHLKSLVDMCRRLEKLVKGSVEVSAHNLQKLSSTSPDPNPQTQMVLELERRQGSKSQNKHASPGPAEATWKK